MIDIHATATIDPYVQIGDLSTIEAFCIVGYRTSSGTSESMRTTTIGSSSLLRQFTVVYWGTTIGDGFQSGHNAIIREECVISEQVSIGTLSVVEHHVTIGARTRVHSQAFIPEHSTIEEDVFIGPNVVLTNAKYPMSREARKHLKGPHIMREAKVGANATILPGITIGERAVVGAGSVVTHNVPAGSVVAGNPAIVINTVDQLPYG